MMPHRSNPQACLHQGKCSKGNRTVNQQDLPCQVFNVTCGKSIYSASQRSRFPRLIAPTTLPKGSKFLQILPGLMVKKSSPSVSASAIRFAIFVHLSLQPSVVRFQSACTGSAAVAKAINDFVWSCECCVCCQLFQPEEKQNLWHTALTALVNCF